MMLSPKLIIGVISCIGIIVFISWNGSSNTNATEENNPLAVTNHSVDYYIKNFQVTTMGATGLPDRSLTSTHLNHFEDDDTTELTLPHIEVYDTIAAPWIIDAKAGWVSSDASLVLLSGDVNITREERAESPAINIVGSNMRVQPEDNYVETDDNVVITSDESRIHSVGMHAWLKAPSRFKFLSNVRGHYVTK